MGGTFGTYEKKRRKVCTEKCGMKYSNAFEASLVQLVAADHWLIEAHAQQQVADQMQERGLIIVWLMLYASQHPVTHIAGAPAESRRFATQLLQQPIALTTSLFL